MSSSKVAEVQEQVKEVKGIMIKNVEQIINNMEKAEDLSEKTYVLATEAERFKKHSNGLKKQMKRKNMKLIAVIVVVVLVILLIIILALEPWKWGQNP